MSVFISDKDKAKLYVQFFKPKQPQIKILVLEWVDLYQRFWSRSKNSQSCVIRSKNSRVFKPDNTLLLVFQQY